MTRMCPKCKSRNIEADLSAQSFAKGSVFNRFKCNNCGYTGEFFPEADK
jgi:predicted nucleic-acid-binding Zn-ribbon protein